MRGWIVIIVLSACANDPVYIPGPLSLEAGLDDGMGGIVEGRASLVLPIDVETAADAAERAALEAELNANRADPLTVPYVRVGDIEVSVEWTITNLDDDDEGLALVELDGANEYFAYDPAVLQAAADEDEPPPPGLAGNIPIRIAPNGQVDGLFREDQVREASIDLDQITRGNVNPFAATLTISKNAESFQPMSPAMPDVEQMPVGDPVPRAAFAQLIRIDLVFKADRHMVLDYTVRVRDVRGIMADELLNTDAAELQAFAPVVYDPAAP